MKKMIGFLSLFLGMLPITSAFGSDIMVMNPWIRETPPTVQTMAAYMVIHNSGKVDKRLVGASSPHFSKIEIHETVHQGDMATMIARDIVVIPAGNQRPFQPNGYHLMLIAPLQPHPLQAGDKIPLTLFFQDGLQKSVLAEVRKSPMQNAGHSNHQEHQHQH